MKCMLMRFANREEWERLPATERDRRLAHHQQVLQELIAERALVGAGRATSGPAAGSFVLTSVELEPDSTTITLRRRNGKHLTASGPFSEAGEMLGGFDLVEFASRADAIEFAKKSTPDDGAVTEIRPVRESWWAYHGPASSNDKKFMLLLVADEAAIAARSPDEVDCIVHEHQLVGLEYSGQKGVLRGESLSFSSARLYPTVEASTLKRNNGKQYLSDGPYAETKEVLAGYMLIDCASEQEAVEWAKKLGPRDGDTVEIRPVRSMWSIYYG